MNGEGFFKQMARRYAETEGQRILTELDGLPEHANPRLKRRIWLKTRMAAMRWAGYGAAVMLVIGLVLWRFFVPVQRIGTNDAPSLAADSAASYEYEMIPLTFTLPAQYQVDAVTQDRAQTIYYISNPQRDAVMLTVVKAEETEMDVSALQSVTINGREAYGHAGKDYSLLAFTANGYDYILTCRYDFKTLTALGKNILV